MGSGPICKPSWWRPPSRWRAWGSVMPHSRATKRSWSSASKHKWRNEWNASASAATMAPPVVELRDISLRFVSYYDKQYSLKRAVIDLLLRREAPVAAAEFWALQNVTLSLRQGERVGIVGSNGAGKSTLLRLMAKIYPPTLGSLTVRGS